MLFRFPFRWGTPTSTATVTTPAAPLWTNLAASGQNWIGDRAGMLPRFEHISANGDTGPQFVKVTDVVS
jgi:hypothetical protein